VLVLSRKVGEQVRIGENIVVTIVAVEGAKVRVGVQAPLETRVVRQELVDRAATPSQGAQQVAPASPAAAANPCLMVEATPTEGTSAT
jgi:carbon storage regulator